MTETPNFSDEQKVPKGTHFKSYLKILYLLSSVILLVTFRSSKRA